MGILDRVKAGAEQAAARAKEEVHDAKTKRELGQAYGDLGRTAFDLIERGAISHSELSAAADRIRALKAELEKEGAAGEEQEKPAETGETEPPPSDQPPSPS